MKCRSTWDCITTQHEIPPSSPMVMAPPNGAPGSGKRYIIVCHFFLKSYFSFFAISDTMKIVISCTSMSDNCFFQNLKFSFWLKSYLKTGIRRTCAPMAKNGPLTQRRDIFFHWHLLHSMATYFIFFLACVGIYAALFSTFFMRLLVFIGFRCAA